MTLQAGGERGQYESIPADHVAFVDLGEQGGPEVDRPDPVVGFVEAAPQCWLTDGAAARSRVAPAAEALVVRWHSRSG